jgi:hypothetical protein
MFIRGLFTYHTLVQGPEISVASVASNQKIRPSAIFLLLTAGN